MHIRQSITALAILLLSCIAAHRLAAQESATVTASGAKIIRRQPTELLLQIDLLGRGKTIKEALGNVDKRKDAADLLLKTLGAEMESVEYGDPTTSNAASASREQMQELIRQRIANSGGATPEGLKIPESVTVTLPLTARWPLMSKNAASLLEEVAGLQKKIEAADIAGMKDNQGLSLAEQELLEESSSYGYDPYSGEERTPPGTPSFSFAAKITPEARGAALREAFQAAQRDAAELAAAAGMELSGLSKLDSNAAGGSSYAEEYYGYGGYRRQTAMSVGEDRLSSQTGELGQVTFTFSVTATFRLRPAGE